MDPSVVRMLAWSRDESFGGERAFINRDSLHHLRRLAQRQDYNIREQEELIAAQDAISDEFTAVIDAGGKAS